MTQSTSDSSSLVPAKPGLLQGIVDQILGTLDKTDERAAIDRVARLRQNQPTTTPGELAEQLIRQRCLQAGAVGAVTSGTATIPGLGTVATLVFGVAADLRATYRLQCELVLEIAALYDHPISLDDKRYVVALVTGMSAGANQVVRKVGVELAERATERLAERAVVKAIPVLGVAASAGMNIVATYLVGRRAQAYFSQDPALLATWNDHVRALTGVDKRQIATWLAETTEHSWRLARTRTGQLTGALITAGQTAGQVLVTRAGETGAAAGAAWQRTRTHLRTSFDALHVLGKRTWARRRRGE
jgi:uncharacterized protein (DUF697 family)